MTCLENTLGLSLQEVLLTLQNEWMNTTGTIAYKLQRMNNHKEQLSKRYCQMKKDDKSAKNKAAEKLQVMVNVSQDTIQVYIFIAGN